VGYPFNQMTGYTVGDTKKKSEGKVKHDIYIESKEFKLSI